VAETAKHLVRSDNSVVAGVCAGLAETLDTDPIVMRVLGILLTVLTFGWGVIAYVILWIVLPKGQACADCIDVSADSENPCGCRDASVHMPKSAYLGTSVGVVLVCLIFAMLLDYLVVDASWYQFWPIVFVAAGFTVMVIPIDEDHQVFEMAVGMTLVGVGAVLTLCSVGFLSWQTIPHALPRVLPILLLAAVVAVLAHRRHNRVLTFCAGALVLVACALTVTVFGVPNEMDFIVLQNPMGGPKTIFYR
jgi:phage shock protein PspC (stress-responsive transcriptional regulator)